MTPVSKQKYADACDVSRQSIYKAIDRGDVVMRPDGRVDLDNSTNKVYMESCLDRKPPKVPKKGKATAKKKTVKSVDKKKKESKGKGKKGAKSVSKSAAEKGESGSISDTENREASSAGQRTIDFEGDLDLEAIPPELRAIFEGGLGDAKKVDLDAMKIFEDIKNKMLDRQMKRMALVERKLVREFCGQLFVIDTTELKTLGIRLAPDLASLIQEKVKIIREEEPEHKDSPILTRVNEFVNSTDFMREINELVTAEVMNTLAHIKRLVDEFLQSVAAEPLEDPVETDKPEPAEVAG